MLLARVDYRFGTMIIVSVYHVLRGEGLRNGVAREPISFHLEFIDAFGDVTHAEEIDCFVEFVSELDPDTFGAAATHSRTRHDRSRHARRLPVHRPAVAAAAAAAAATAPASGGSTAGPFAPPLWLQYLASLR